MQIRHTTHTTGPYNLIRSKITNTLLRALIVTRKLVHSTFSFSIENHYAVCFFLQLPIDFKHFHFVHNALCVCGNGQMSLNAQKKKKKQQERQMVNSSSTDMLWTLGAHTHKVLIYKIRNRSSRTHHVSRLHHNYYWSSSANVSVCMCQCIRVVATTVGMHFFRLKKNDISAIDGSGHI